MKCLKCNGVGESDCEFANANVMLACFECGHDCVKQLNEQLEHERSERRKAERLLLKYREAVRPFMDNCRAVVEIADEMERNGVK